MHIHAGLLLLSAILAERGALTRGTVVGNFFDTPQQNRFNLDILPEYKLEKHTFFTPVTTNCSECSNYTVLYRMPEGPQSPGNSDKMPMLIERGILCDEEHCTADKPLIAVAYIMVDQGYDVWLGQSRFADIRNATTNEDAEREHLTQVSQYILSLTHQPEMSVMGYMNGSSNSIFGIKAKPETNEEQSTVSRWLDENIPGVATAKQWFATGRSYLTNSYEKMMQGVDYLGKSVDVVIDDLSIRQIKEKVLKTWGIVTTMILPTLTIDDFSRSIDHPDVFLSTVELVRKYGYEPEEHAFTTSDGYILTAHRIAGGPSSPSARGKPVIILQHGILSSSADWVITGPSHALGYRLSDEGYDVWMGNSRGNTYSTRHVELTSSSSKFWDFSWHEMGTYDMPALIDYVLGVTGAENVTIIAHSQGNTQLLVMLSEKPEYNSKISRIAMFAPVAYIGHMKSPIELMLAKISTPIYYLLRTVGVDRFLQTNGFLTQLGRDMCESRSVIQVICSNALFLITGYDATQMNQTILPIILGHVPAGASTKQFLHYGQLYNSKKFRQFDQLTFYGNWKKYGQFEPPDYDLRNVRVPVAIFYAQNDWLVDQEDVERLARELPNLEMKRKVDFEYFNHIDFLYAIDAPRLVYQQAIDYLRPDDNAVE